MTTHGEDQLHLHIDPKALVSMKAQHLEAFYEEILRNEIPPLAAKWHQTIPNLPTYIVTIKAMKRRWGSCHPLKRHITLNVALAKHPLPLLELVFVHELVHLFEANHSPRFYDLMDQYYPQWRRVDRELKKLSIGFATCQ